MNSGIYLIQQNEELIKMTENPYDSERLLQEILEKYPDLLAGDQINESAPRRWMFIARELGIPGEEDGANRWSIDHLFLDQDAIPTFVEVKRSSDTRIRRQVVGQMLDYAANATAYWPIETIKARFEMRCQKQNVDSEIVLAELLTDAMNYDDYWQMVKINLQAGRIRLIFLADHIPDELRSIVEFLNRQMDPAEVLAVEIPQFIGQGLRCLVPRVIGQTSEIQQKKSGRTSPKWDEATFFDALQKRSVPLEIQYAQRVLIWAKQHVTRIDWGTGKQMGSFVPVIIHKNREHKLFAVWTYGAIELYFYWYAYKPPFDDENERLILLDKLNMIPGINISPENISKRPSIQLSQIASEEIFQKFITVFEWFIERIRI